MTIQKKKHTVDSAIKSLSKKRDINIVNNVIEVRRGKKSTQDLGNGSWGKVDFLCNHKGYIQVFVD